MIGLFFDFLETMCRLKKKVQCPILLPKLHDGERQCTACTYTKRNGNDKPAPAKISKPVATKALRALDMSSPYNCTNKGEKYIRLEITTKISICNPDSRKQWKLDNWKVNTILCLTRFCNYITVNQLQKIWSHVLLFVTGESSWET